MPVTEVKPRDAVATGIAYGVTFEGMVPPYEEREVARFGRYNWTDWRALPSYERAACVAHFRLHNLIEIHQQDAVGAESRRRSRANEKAR